MIAMKKTLSGFVRSLCALCFLFAFSGAAFSESLSSWFRKPLNKAQYGTVETDIRALADAVKSASLSESLLVARLQEAAQKRVSPQVLLTALKKDAARYVSLSSALRARDLQPKKNEPAAALVFQFDILLRTGLPEAALPALLDASAKRYAQSAQNDTSRKTAMDGAMAALSTIAFARAKYQMSNQACLSLAAAMSKGNFSETELVAAVESERKAAAERDSVLKTASPAKEIPVQSLTPKENPPPAPSPAPKPADIPAQSPGNSVFGQSQGGGGTKRKEK